LFEPSAEAGDGAEGSRPCPEEREESARAFLVLSRQRRPDLQLAIGTIDPQAGRLHSHRDAEWAATSEALPGRFAPAEVPGLRLAEDDRSRSGGKVAGERPREVKGGCPFVEDDILYLTANGWVQPCWVVDSEEFHIGRFEGGRGFGELLNGPEMNRLRHALRLDRREEARWCSACDFSLAGMLNAGSLEQFWRGRDDQGLVLRQDERRYIFGRVTPSEHRATRLELGCGSTKEPGFVGVDRFALPGVDVVANLDDRLPFGDDSVDLVYASHSLEHVRSLTFTVGEIYRACKHGAQVCIVAPYYQQALNLANPYHKQVFNEHTPRFWTVSPLTLVDPRDYTHPNSPDWGLLHSDNSSSNLDFRCLRIEYFYFPKYRDLPPDQQRDARSRYLDVCDQIMYHLVAVKRPIGEEEFYAMASKIEYFTPPHVQSRQLREENERLARKLRELSEKQARELESRARELGERTAKHAEEIQELQARAEFFSKSSEFLLHRLNAAAQSGLELEAERARLHGELNEALRREQELHQHIVTLTGGTSWRAVQLLLQVRHRLAPRGSLRERIGRRLMQSQRRARALVRRYVVAGP
jgi:radical SAM protein with 4Fe4S-binding SPASM domain